MITQAALKSSLTSMGYNVIGMTNNAKTGLIEILKLKPDIAILDINLDGNESGIWLAEQLIDLKIEIPCIYLTAYSDKETIKEASKTAPYGFIIKPFNEKDLFAAIEIAIENFKNKELQIQLLNKKSNKKHIKKSIFIKDEHLYIKLLFKNIFFIKSDGHYLEIHSKHKKYVIRSKMHSFHELLPQKTFMQVHRSHVVNIEKITSFSHKFLMVGESRISISDTYKLDLLNKLNKL